MKYTVTVDKEAKVSAPTSLAIQKFKDIRKAEKKIEKLEGELSYWMQQIPEEEMGAYMDITNEMLKRE